MKLNLNEIEARLLALLQAANHLLPQGELNGMIELVQAGEPGIALENFCTQLAEHDAEVPASILIAINELGRAMGIQSRYWESLKTRHAAHLTANGKQIPTAFPCTIETFLLSQKLLPKSVVVEHNGEAVAPSEFSNRPLQPGDRLEIVQIVAGG
ncbi:MAG TPA: sulfur carrier protein ThiS [Verrucomicrobiae bacterium]